MLSSNELAELAGALCKAQGGMMGAKKDSENPFFKSKYADLASVWDVCRKPLSENGLSVVQTTSMPSLDRVALETTLLHISGQWIQSTYPVKPVKDDPQGLGAALTYARRYGLMAMIGIAPEDDDGETAAGRGQKEKKMEAQVKPQEKKGPAMVTEAQIKKIHVDAKKSGLDEATYYALLLKRFGVKSSKELTVEQASKLIEEFNAPPAEEPPALDGLEAAIAGIDVSPGEQPSIDLAWVKERMIAKKVTVQEFVNKLRLNYDVPVAKTASAAIASLNAAQVAEVASWLGED